MAGNLSWDTAEAHALMVPGCPRDAGGMAQIQSTPGARSQSPPSKLPLLTCFMNCNPPTAKSVLSQCSIIPNSCSKGNSLLTTDGILQPRVALEGRASTACMGDGVLQSLRLQSGALRRRGGAKNLSRDPDTGRKNPRKAEAAEDKSPTAQKHSHQPFPSGQTTQLGPTSFQPPLQQDQGAAGKLHHKSIHSLEGSETTPLFYPGVPTCLSLFPKRDCPAGWSGTPATPEPCTAMLAHKLLH